jgi:hypothetical protein
MFDLEQRDLRDVAVSGDPQLDRCEHFVKARSNFMRDAIAHSAAAAPWPRETQPRGWHLLRRDHIDQPRLRAPRRRHAFGASLQEHPDGGDDATASDAKRRETAVWTASRRASGTAAGVLAPRSGGENRLDRGG